MSAHYVVSFEFQDTDANANSQDFRDLLMEKFEQAVLEGRMTNVIVRLNHVQNVPSSDQMQQELIAAGWRKIGATSWANPSGGVFRGPAGAWRAMRFMAEDERPADAE